MRLLINHHHRKLYRALNSDFWNLELSVWLHTLARSLISIFIPILMLQLGYSLKIVLIYYLILHVVDVPLNFIARRLIIKFGARAVIIIATLISILYFTLFYNLGSNKLIIFFALAFVDAFYDAFYWVSHMYIFMESSDKPDQASKNTGILSSVKSFAGMLGPVFGTIILLFTNQKILIICSIFIFLISIFPLFKIRHIKDKPINKNVSISAFFKDLREKRDYLSVMLYSINSTAEHILWPIFIFTVFGTIKSIGIIAVIVSLGNIIFMYLTGIINKKKQKNLILFGSLAIILIWVLRLFLPGYLIYYVSIFVVGFFAIMINIPLESNIVERSKLKDTLMASTVRNASTMLPQIFIFGLLIIVVSVFKVSIMVAILSLLGLIFVNAIFLKLLESKKKDNIKLSSL